MMLQTSTWPPSVKTLSPPDGMTGRLQRNKIAHPQEIPPLQIPRTYGRQQQLPQPLVAPRYSSAFPEGVRIANGGADQELEEDVGNPWSRM